MASLLESVRPLAKQYLDKTQFDSLDAQRQATSLSRTIYVGNLHPFTTEERVHAAARKCGPVRRVIMGLHRIDRRPCGFCFVEFAHRRFALAAESLLNGVKLEGNVIKVEMDPGFTEGRQFGRARSGGQVRNEPRTEVAFRRTGRNAPGEPRRGPMGYRGEREEREEREREMGMGMGMGRKRERGKEEVEVDEDEKEAVERRKQRKRRRARREESESESDSDW